MKTTFDDPTNRCEDCEFSYMKLDKNKNVYHICKLDPERINAFGCDDELLGNNAESLPNYPLDDYDDDSELGGHYKNEPWQHIR